MRTYSVISTPKDQEQKKGVEHKITPRLSPVILLEPTRIAKILGIIALLLLIGSLCSNFLTGIDLIRRFGHFLYVDEEKNIPTAYSVMLLQSSAILLTVIAIIKWKESSSYYLHWAILSFGFLFMALDEGWGIHEWVSHFFKPMHGFLTFTWIIPFLFLLPILFFVFLKFIKSLPVRTRLYFMMAGIVYISGTIGFESISAYYFDLHGPYDYRYYLTVTIEEGLEMFGVVIFIYALLDYLYNNYKELRFILNK